MMQGYLLSSQGGNPDDGFAFHSDDVINVSGLYQGVVNETLGSLVLSTTKPKAMKASLDLG